MCLKLYYVRGLVILLIDLVILLMYNIVMKVLGKSGEIRFINIFVYKSWVSCKVEMLDEFLWEVVGFCYE